MVIGISLALLASLAYGLLGVTFEAASKRHYAPWDFIFWKQLCGSILIFAVVLAMGKNLWQVNILVLALIGACSYVLTCACYLVASRERDIAANWTILNLSVLVPLAASVFWFGDKFTWIKGAGVAVTLAAIVMIGGETSLSVIAATSKWKVFILAAFLMNGVLTTLFRWVPSDLSFLFVAYFYALSCLIALVFKLVQGVHAPSRGMLAWATGGASSHCAGMLLTMAALAAIGKASRQPGLIVYPITNGFVIPLGVILGALILRQKITAYGQCGVAVGVLGLLLLSIP
jgi:drug/metabolite transporter (DMT)-like permease